ncbi:MAG TPA: hypothetical protein VHC69_06135 [Polyangiaceae bacterium]|nr:hypothetical protein [Polyangiaceae bacterium]
MTVVQSQHMNVLAVNNRILQMITARAPHRERFRPARRTGMSGSVKRARQLDFRESNRRKHVREVGLIAMWLGFAGVADAAEPAPVCADERISLEGELDAKWRAPIENLCARFGTMSDVDPSARIRLVAAGSELALEVTLGDGRVAHRTLRSPDDLITVLEALTLQIPGPPPENRPPPPPVVNAPVPPEPATSSLPKGAVTRPPAVEGTSRRSHYLGVEIGLAVEGRLSGSPAYLSLGGSAYAALRPDDWFFGVVARWQPSEVPASSSQPGFEMESAGAGFAVAHRLLKTGLLGLDAGATTMVLVDTQSLESRSPDEIGASTAVRFGILARALVGRGSWKFAPSLDADIAPARLGHNARLDNALPPLPTWSIALAIGATWAGE